MKKSKLSLRETVMLVFLVLLLIVPKSTGDSAPPLPDAFGLPASWGYAAGPGHQLRGLILLAEQEMYHKRRIASDE